MSAEAPELTTKDQIDAALKEAWEFENAGNIEQSIATYDKAIHAIEVYTTNAQPEDKEALTTLLGNIRSHADELKASHAASKTSGPSVPAAPEDKSAQQPPAQPSRPLSLSEQLKRAADSLAAGITSAGQSVSKAINDFDQRHQVTETISKKSNEAVQKVKAFGESSGISAALESAATTISQQTRKLEAATTKFLVDNNIISDPRRRAPAPAPGTYAAQESVPLTANPETPSAPAPAPAPETETLTGPSEEASAAPEEKPATE